MKYLLKMKKRGFYMEYMEFGALLITFITFLLFIFSRIFIICAAKDEQAEKFILEYKDTLQEGDIKEVIEIGNHENGETIYIISNSVIRNINIHEIKYKKNPKIGKKIFGPYKLKKGEVIGIKMTIPCGRPSHCITYQRSDFIKGKLVLGQEGKSSRLFEQELKHTLRSLLYYFSKL